MSLGIPATGLFTAFGACATPPVIGLGAGWRTLLGTLLALLPVPTIPKLPTVIPEIVAKIWKHLAPNKSSTLSMVDNLTYPYLVHNSSALSLHD